jgi:hypothetical protein
MRPLPALLDTTCSIGLTEVTYYPWRQSTAT